ncbi:iron-sulfur cluster repair protein YtfE [Leeia sp. TBRC 13508]|uniref:Iron-sulfur cluster repair protein YtfE n=1 Tax=Leeia speluncae TaxID=2884804 RepID=A0ABS8D8T4_9NEIS|nr:iron-sulfur cluster repair protein YtfE [Leeia speluncae]MCB6184579.1 iron-sulfur cluster repair protein YtfE [Leeia speluncae]
MNAPTNQQVFELDPTLAIGQIAVALPGSTAVFRELKLDYCCGGQLSLAEAVAKKGLTLEDVLARLANLQRTNDLPVDLPTAELIDHILARYHEVHRQQLPELIAMAKRVEAVHRDDPDVPSGLAALLAKVADELESHMQKEEQILFPMLKAGGNPFVVHPIAVMRSEHTDHGENVAALMLITNDMTPPAHACNTWRALFSGIQQLCDDLINHIHLENNVLFPIFEVKPEVKSEEKCEGNCGCH